MFELISGVEELLMPWLDREQYGEGSEEHLYPSIRDQWLGGRKVGCAWQSDLLKSKDASQHKPAVRWKRRE